MNNSHGGLPDTPKRLTPSDEIEEMCTALQIRAENLSKLAADKLSKFYRTPPPPPMEGGKTLNRSMPPFFETVRGHLWTTNRFLDSLETIIILTDK